MDPRPSFPIFNQAGNLYRVTGIAADITDRRELEEQLRQAQRWTPWKIGRGVAQTSTIC
jgi:hypothetical protein